MLLRAVPFQSGWGGGERNGRVFERGEGPHSVLYNPIRLYIFSGRRGGVSNF